MSESREVTLTVNGAPRTVQVPPAESLQVTLSERLDLFSVRATCGIGVCGSCTVLLDGTAVSSCLLLTGMVDGQDVVTAEGLADADGGAVQESFVAHQAFQCSFCIPAMTVSVQALLRENPQADAEQVREHLGGNLCRCGTYPQILEAVLALTGHGDGAEVER